MSQRIASLDLIRGVAVLAILLVYIYAFALPHQAYDTPYWLLGAATEADLWVYSSQQLFVNNRFVTLFSLLFGAGLALQMQRMQQDGRNANKLMQRRLVWLLVFGLLHGVFIWFGDILTIYALVGLVIYRWAGKSALWLFKRAAIVYALGCGIMLLMMALLDLAEVTAVAMSDDPWATLQLTGPGLAEQAGVWTGPYIGQIYTQALFFSLSLFTSSFGFAWLVVGMMLCGMGLYHHGFFHRGLSGKRIGLLLVIGLAISLIDLWFNYNAGFLSATSSLSPLPMIAAACMALAYAALIVRWASIGGWLARAFQSAGQLAFTLYLSQSVAMVLLFRWLMPDLWGQLSRLECLAVVAVYSLVQLVFAVVWRKYCGQGPLERLWRWLVTH